MPEPQQQDAPRCIGFGETEDRCTNVATANADILDPPLWCAGCEARRVAAIDASFASISQVFDARGGA